MNATTITQQQTENLQSYRVVFTDTTETFVKASNDGDAMTEAVRQQQSHGRNLVASRAEKLTALIDKESHLYKRRLVREIRDTFARCGVYYTDRNGQDVACGRIVAVKFGAGIVYVKLAAGEPWLPTSDPDGFRDGYGQNICASRHPKFS